MPSIRKVSCAMRLKLRRKSTNASPTSIGSKRKCEKLEAAALISKAAVALCDGLPVMEFVNPVAGIAVTITDIAQTIQGNKGAIQDLVEHSSAIAEIIVKRVTDINDQEGDALNLASNVKDDIFMVKKTLQAIHDYIIIFKDRKKWQRIISSKSDKDEIARLQGKLARLLSTFTAARTVVIEQKIQLLGRNVNEVSNVVVRRIDVIEQNVQLLVTAANHTQNEIEVISNVISHQPIVIRGPAPIAANSSSDIPSDIILEPPVQNGAGHEFEKSSESYELELNVKHSCYLSSSISSR
ncbi:hypothetical protein BDQ12DRAFT_724208 [Crucibulum laeve]|uniref:Uncharacterized protein n=1 Tax=Crucibulum laeve TaxID=68775 RepID=A0A5C3LXD6_9AGAR|nr:hypothetical protein BDQ12DRAFT_724208 [Crucibulum laeve]